MANLLEQAIDCDDADRAARMAPGHHFWFPPSIIPE